MFLINSRSHRFSAAPFCSTREGFHIQGAHLLPKLRCQFAEFLNPSSLKRLGILSPPTCVGLEYGQHRGTLTRSFSWKSRITRFRSLARRLAPPHHVSALSLRLWPSPPTNPAYSLELPSIRQPGYLPPSLLVKPSVLVQECSPASHRLRVSASP